MLIKAPPSIWYQWRYLPSTDFSKETRFRIMLSSWMSIKDAEMVNSALRRAKQFHWYKNEQLRDTWERYFEHKKWVLLIWHIEYGCIDVNSLCAKALHDVMEDANALVTELINNFNAEIARQVMLLTKPKKTKNWIKIDKETYENELRHYYWAISNDPVVWATKVEDGQHNARTLILPDISVSEQEMEKTKASIGRNIIKLRTYVEPIARIVQVALKTKHFDAFARDLDDAETRCWLKIWL